MWGGRRRVQLLGFACLIGGCAAVAGQRGRGLEHDFFPLTPHSRWEYAVQRPAGAARFRFIATVKQDDFIAADGRPCRVVDERYTDGTGGKRFPILYCTEGGFLHRVMSLEYRGNALEDNGMRSGELKFLPVDLSPASSWEGWTNAYRLPDGSGFAVQQFHRSVPQPETIEVPAGRFERCVRVETTAVHSAMGADGARVGPTIVFYYSDWYAPGVGLVKTEQRDTSAEVVATVELVRFNIGQEVATR